jgi:hypothetical protein
MAAVTRVSLSLCGTGAAEHPGSWHVIPPKQEENTMGLGKGALLWLIGIPLPIILLLALFWR